MKLRHAQGTSLIEVLFVVATSAVVLSGAAAHFRTLRQTNDLTDARREALQNARVALDRLARDLRAAKTITSLTAPTNTAGSITITDSSGVNHVYSLVGSEIRCGLLAATDLLAANVKSLSFQGYDGLGTVPETNPGGIDAVQISLTASIPNSTGTIPLATRVRLRRQTGGACRSYASYAAAYTTTLGSGLSNPTNAYGAPNGTLARLGDTRGGRYSGFGPGSYTGTVYCVLAGTRLYHYKNSLQLTIRYDSTVLLDKTYTNSDLAPVHGLLGWWWLDITSTRKSWTATDLDNLSIEVRDPGASKTQVDFDCFVIRSFFDPPKTTFIWADRLGKLVNNWQSPANAFGAPNSAYATGSWTNEDYQSFGFAAPTSKDEILTVAACVQGYVTATIADDRMQANCAPSGKGWGYGTTHNLVASDLNPFVGFLKQGAITSDLTNDRVWAWGDFGTYEARFFLDRVDGADAALWADAVGWRVLCAPSGGKGISQWSEK